MNLVLIAALIAVCSAAKLDKTYLPPASAKTAGGSPGFLQTPLTRSSEEVPIGLPIGGYTNAAEGVVVDAASAGTRNSPDADQTALGGPRTSYGSTASKVGDAAFRDSLPGFNQFPAGFDRSLPVDGRPPGLHRLLSPERPEASKDRNSNILSYENNVDTHNYNYGFESDNGIAVGENGVSHDGVHAQGGYSYKGDDGKVYSVTYTADKDGYKPQGSHLPTPPPIPDEIQKSIEQNAKEEAAGVVNDGSYDAQKYNAEGDYTESDSNKHGDKLDSQFAKRPEVGGTVVGASINKNQPTSAFTGNTGSYALTANRPQTFAGYKPFNSYNGLSSQSFGHNAQHNSAGNVNQNSQGLGSESSLEHLGQNSQTGNQAQSGQSETGSGSQSTTGSHFHNHGFQSNFGEQSTKPLIGQQPVISDSSSLSSSQVTQDLTQFGAEPSLTSGTNLQSFGANQLLQVNQDAASVGNAPVSTQYGDEIQNQQHDVQSGTTAYGKPIVPGQGSSSSFASTGQFGNTFGVTNQEHLPPLNTVGSSGKPASTLAPQKPTYGTISTPNSAISALNSGGKPSGFLPQGAQTHFASSQNSASESYFNSGAPQKTDSQLFQSFNVQSQQPSNIHTGQFPQSTQVPSSQGHSQFDTLNHHVSYSKPNHGAQSTQTNFGVPNVHPTLVPQTELATPLESLQSHTSDSFPSPTATSNLATFNPQPSFQSTQHFGIQSGSVKPSGTSQSFLTSSLLTPSAQNSADAQLTSGKDESNLSTITSEKEPQKVSQSGVGDAQYASPSPKPSFGQQSQGVSNSYYYNQPSKPFSTPQPRPQGSRFPVTSSNQFNTLTGQQFSHSSGDVSNLPGSQSPRPDQSTGLNKYPNPPLPVASTSFTQKESTISQASYNGITQAAIAPFSTGSPTPASQFNSPSESKPGVLQPINQLNQGQFASSLGLPSNSNDLKPSQQGLPQKPSNNFGLNQNVFQGQLQQGQAQPIKPLENQNELGAHQEINTQTNPTQHYTGEIYEYNKPAQGLPAPSLQVNASPNTPAITQSSLKPQSGQTQSTQSFTNYQTQTSEVQKESTSHELVQPAKPQVSQASELSSPNTDISTQTQPEQNSRPQLVQPFKPFSTSTQFGTQPTKPQFGQNIEASYGNVHYQPQTSQASFSQLGSQPSKPVSTSTNSGFTSPVKPLTLQQNSNTGSQSSYYNQNAQSPHESVVTTSSQSFTQGSSTPFESQPLKPFGAIPPSQSHEPQPAPSSKPQFGTQPIKPQLPQITSSIAGNTNSVLSTQQQQSSQISHNQFGTQPSKPFGSIPITTTFGVQQSKPQFGQNTHSNYGSTQTSPIVPTSQQQPIKSSQTQFGSQSYKPYGSTHTTSVSRPIVSQFGVAPTKTQFGQSLHPTQSSAYASSSSTQEQSNLDSRPQASYQPYRPFGSGLSQFGSQYHSQPTKTQFGQTIQPTQSNAYASSSVSNIQEQASLDSRPQFGAHTYTPFGNVPSQFGQDLPTTHSSAYASSSTSNSQEPATFATQPKFPSQQFKPFGSTQSKPFLTAPVSQFNTQPAKPQFGQNLQPTQSSAFASSSASNLQEPSTLDSQPKFPSQQFKPFGNAQSNPILTSPVSQFGSQPAKPQFGQNLQPAHSSAYASSSASNAQEPSTYGSQPQFPSQQYKPFGSGQSHPSLTSQFGTQPSKTQSSAHASSSTSNTQQQYSHIHQPQFASHQFKPYGSAHLTPVTTTTAPHSSSAYASSSSSQEQSADSRPHVIQAYKPFNAPSASVPQTQFGIQTAPSFGQSAQAIDQSAHGSHSQQTAAQPQVGNQPFKPFGNTAGSSIKQTQQESKPQIGFGKPISQTVQPTTSFGAPSSASNQASSQSSTSHVSNTQSSKPAETSEIIGEKFDGPREPPRFDDKTGYHY